MRSAMRATRALKTPGTAMGPACQTSRNRRPGERAGVAASDIGNPSGPGRSATFDSAAPALYHDRGGEDYGQTEGRVWGTFSTCLLMLQARWKRAPQGGVG